jgi:hypothetical protein
LKKRTRAAHAEKIRKKNEPFFWRIFLEISVFTVLTVHSEFVQTIFNPLTHWGGGPFGPPLFKRPVAQKAIKLKKFGKISYSMEIVLALKLSSGVSSKKTVLYK